MDSRLRGNDNLPVILATHWLIDELHFLWRRAVNGVQCAVARRQCFAQHG
jgi:hypothetical protein